MYGQAQIMPAFNMYILHIETSTSVCSIALSWEKAVIDFVDLAEGMNHTALITPAIDQLLKNNKLTPGDLSAVAVCSGPGSFTGLRVGNSTAKAMAYTLGIPVIAVPTLLPLAHAASIRYPEADLLMPMIDARRMEVYTILYDQQMEEIEPVCSLVLQKGVLDVLLPKDKQVVCCGNGAFKVKEIASTRQLIVDTSLVCSAVHMVVPAVGMMERGTCSDPLHYVPFYLKPPNITQPRIVG